MTRWPPLLLAGTEQRGQCGCVSTTLQTQRQGRRRQSFDFSPNLSQLALTWNAHNTNRIQSRLFTRKISENKFKNPKNLKNPKKSIKSEKIYKIRKNLQNPKTSIKSTKSEKNRNTRKIYKIRKKSNNPKNQ